MSGVPGTGDPRIHLVRGKLPALAGFRPLRHLDLDVVGVRQVHAGDPEPPGCHLLDRAAPGRVQQPVDVLAAFAGVGAGTQLVHGDRQRLVRLLGDRPVGHRPGGEPLHDFADRFHLLDRHRRAQPGLQLHQTAQRHQSFGLLVHCVGVLAEHVVPLGAGGMLQPEHGLRVEQVWLTLPSPLVLPTDPQVPVGVLTPTRGVGVGMPASAFFGDLVQADPAELADRAGEVLVDQVLGQPDSLENLCPAIGGDGGDAHLAHHLEHALAQRVDQVAHRLLRSDPFDQAAADQVLHRLHRQVGVDRGRAVAHQQGDVVHLSHVPGLDDQADLGTGLFPGQVMVHRTGQQQRRDRGPVRVRVPVGQHDEPGPVGDLGRHLGTDVRQPLPQRGPAAADPVQAAHPDGFEPGHVTVDVEVLDLGQVVVVDDREVDLHGAGVCRGGVQQAAG